MTISLPPNALGDAPAGRGSNRHDWRGEIARIARLVAALDSRRQRTLDRLAGLVDYLAPTGLTAVSGEQALLDEIRTLYARGRDLVRGMPGQRPADVVRDLDELEALLADPRWDLGDEAVRRLEEDRALVEQERADLDRRLKEWPLQMDARRRALDEADQSGVVVPEQAALLKTIDTLLTQAKAAQQDGDYGGVAERLARLDALESLAGQEQFLQGLAEERNQVGPIAQRAELLIIKSEEAVSEVVEYTVMLRTPRTEGQGANLQSSSVVVRQDRAELRAVVEKITAVVQQHVRAARSAARDTSAAGGQAGTARESAPYVRGFVLDEEDEDRAAAADLTEQLRDVGRLLYTLFLPDLIQRLLDEVATSVVITTNDMEMPWELLHDDVDFLCVRRPLGREPLGQNFPRRRRGTREINAGARLRVLLLGSDPRGDLSGVTREVEHIDKTLKKTWGDSVHIVPLVGADLTGVALNDHLRSGSFHVIHYAGHASFDAGNPERSRLLLHKEEPCFAQKIQRILEGNPLVFISACESSSTTNEAGRRSTTYFAEETQGLASAFIYGGASACVGSLWPVFDDTAAELAAQFYQRLFEGHMVGRALLLARQAVRERPEDQVTWAAYALYGDPRYRLPFRPVSVSQQRTT